MGKRPPFHIAHEGDATVISAGGAGAPVTVKEPVIGSGTLIVRNIAYLEEIRGFSEIRCESATVIHRAEGVAALHGTVQLHSVASLTALEGSGHITLGHRDGVQYLDQLDHLAVDGDLTLLNVSISSLAPSTISARRVLQEKAGEHRLDIINCTVIAESADVQCLNNSSLVSPHLPAVEGIAYHLKSHEKILREEAPLVLREWKAHLAKESTYLSDLLGLTLHDMADDTAMTEEDCLLFVSLDDIIRQLCERTHGKFAQFLQALKTNYRIALPGRGTPEEHSLNDLLARHEGADHQLIVLSVYEDLARSFGTEFVGALGMILREQGMETPTEQALKVAFGDAPLHQVFQQIYLQVSEKAAQAGVLALEAHGFFSGTGIALAEHSDMVREGGAIYRQLEKTYGKKFTRAFHHPNRFAQMERLLTTPLEDMAARMKFGKKEKANLFQQIARMLAVEPPEDGFVTPAYLIYRRLIPACLRHAPATASPPAMRASAAVHSQVAHDGTVMVGYLEGSTIIAADAHMPDTGRNSAFLPLRARDCVVG